MSATFEQPAVTGESRDGLMARLRRLEDKERLRSLMIRGWRALDARDWETWIACWTDHALMEFGPWPPIRGREEILRVVSEAEAPYDSMQHHILNMEFDVVGDTATGIGYMWFVAVPEPHLRDRPYAMGGPYAWEFVRTADGWRLSRQRLGVSWETGEDPTRAFSEQSLPSDHEQSRAMENKFRQNPAAAGPGGSVKKGVAL
ncbi:nuclear transport factor 2 family protein [Streptomyces sp. NPDC006923]|uniref:nuclear transport factor 2 family protein n=1 Tax=Streptomyces sp. NPDC006923 TaxID=3155355 RepID=UPI00340104BF